LGAGVKLGGNSRSFFYGALLYDVLYNSDQGAGSTNCAVLDDTGTPFVYRFGFALGI